MNVYAKSICFMRCCVTWWASQPSKRWQEIVRRHSQQNITAADVQTVFEEMHGADLDWFFKQWLQGTPTVDYSKREIKKYRRDDGTWVTEVTMQRNGDGVMPVDVEVELDGGEKMMKRWDGKSETGTVVFETEEKPEAVNVDPQDRIMDSNRLNSARPRIEIRPDWPLLRYIHMPNDALLVLWRPMLDYNDYDSVRRGLRAASSYRAFYHNVTVELVMGVKSAEFDGKLAYSHPFSKSNLLNRYNLMARKNEGRFATQAHVEFYGSKGFLASSSAVCAPASISAGC